MGATPVATGGGGGGGGSGTVTSVALSAPAEFSVTGSPITAAGTLVLAWQSVAANRVMAGPDGASGTPSFRALVAADLPDLSGTYATLIHVHAASDVTNGTFDNARVNWAAPGAIGGTTPAQVTATDVMVTGEIKRQSGNLAIRSVDANVLIYAADTLVGGYTSTSRVDYVPLTVAVSSSATNTVRTLATLSHAISGVAAAGLGGGLLYQIEDAGGTLRDAVSINALWQTATGGGTTYTDFYGLVAGTSTRLLRLGGNATTARVQLPVSLILESNGLLLSFTNDNVNIRRSNDEMILSSYGTSNRIFSFQQGVYPTTSELFGIYATWCALPAASALNFGANTTDGTWRIVRSGNDLVFERRESGAWVEKGRFTA